MKKTLLVAVNARFSHTNLAVRSLKLALDAAGIPAAFVEYTINQPVREILADIVSRAPDRLLFSCYIWNIRQVEQLGSEFRALFPDIPILLGGPEVSFDPEDRLARYGWADGILCGEGELIIAQVLSEPHPRGIFRASRFADLDALPFPYSDLASLPNRVLYYESSRGCPYGCSYCLSSADRTVRFRSLPLVFDDLQKLLDARVMQVKFVDRTFNLRPDRASAIWQYLAAHDNGYTSFQMELGGDLTTPDQLRLLQTVRPGLFQFEIGVQSTCAAALAAAARPTDLQTLRDNVCTVGAFGNIHQHLDLIAGLPLEGFERFAQSYDEVFAMRPHQLQLGFLKLLRGSRLYEQREQYGLVYSETPPYEILQTPQLSFHEICRIKRVEEMTELYYNSGRFQNQLACLLRDCPSPFRMFLALSERMPAQNVGKYACYDLLFTFAVEQGCDPEVFSWLMRLDLCLHERPRRLPEHCAAGNEPRRRLLLPGKPGPQEWVELFPFDPLDPQHPQQETLVRFDYTLRDPFGNASCTKIEPSQSA